MAPLSRPARMCWFHGWESTSTTRRHSQEGQGPGNRAKQIRYPSSSSPTGMPAYHIPSDPSRSLITHRGVDAQAVWPLARRFQDRAPTVP